MMTAKRPRFSSHINEKNSSSSPPPSGGFILNTDKNSFFGTEEGVVSIKGDNKTGSLIYGPQNLPGQIGFVQTPPMVVVGLKENEPDDPLKDELVLRVTLAEIVDMQAGTVDISRTFPESLRTPELEDNINSFIDRVEDVVSVCSEALRSKFGHAININTPNEISHMISADKLSYTKTNYVIEFRIKRFKSKLHGKALVDEKQRLFKLRTKLAYSYSKEIPRLTAAEVAKKARDATIQEMLGSGKWQHNDDIVTYLAPSDANAVGPSTLKAGDVIHLNMWVIGWVSHGRGAVEFCFNPKSILLTPSQHSQSEDEGAKKARLE